MPHPHRLLKLARKLFELPTKRLEQESLRRAVSTAYYAIFHLLSMAGSRLIATTDNELAATIARDFSHEEMRQVSGQIAEGKLPKRLSDSNSSPVIPDQLKQVARAFLSLQGSRHDADYDLAMTFLRDDVGSLLDEVEQAFLAWEVIRTTDAARLYLMTCLLHSRWKEKPRMS